MADTNIKDILTKRDTFLDFQISDLIGVALMIIPCLISLRTFQYTEKVIPFLPFKRSVDVSIAPNSVTSLGAAAVYYCSFIVRYGIFRKGNVIETVVSVLRTFLNCWVVGALFTVIITTNSDEVFSILGYFKLNTFSLLLFAVILSWIGMRTLAGYSWILFVLAALPRMEAVNSAMGSLGAVFVLTFLISMFLQVSSFMDVKDFMKDLRNMTGKYASEVGDNMSAAANDASSRVRKAVSAAKDKIRKKVE